MFDIMKFYQGKVAFKQETQMSIRFVPDYLMLVK